jgi:hypothetical protein
VELAVLADRGGRELPVAARFVGGVVDVPANATLVLTRDDDGTLSVSRFTPKHAPIEREPPAAPRCRRTKNNSGWT